MNTYTGKIENGKFTKSQNVHELLKSLEGKNITLVVYEGDKRHLGQNAYFHLCLSYICKVTGNNIETEKNLFKDEYQLYDDREFPDGKVRRIYHQTRSMSQSKFAEITQWLKVHADFFNAKIPTYEDYLAGKYNKIIK